MNQVHVNVNPHSFSHKPCINWKKKQKILEHEKAQPKTWPLSETIITLKIFYVLKAYIKLKKMFYH